MKFDPKVLGWRLAAAVGAAIFPLLTAQDSNPWHWGNAVLGALLVGAGVDQVAYQNSKKGDR